MNVIHLFTLANMLTFVNMQEDDDEPRKPPTYGYKTCPNINPIALNVHIVPHSHNDVGWLKTVEEYYWGLNSHVQKAGVHNIFESIITALLQNPERRYISVETAFFYKWWSYASNERKIQFRNLVENGQIEVVGAGWTMNDEATTNYQEIIDQFTLGLRVIKETLGLYGIPKVAWQIDPFGHSREMASIFSQMGFDAIFLGRIDFKDRLARISTNTLEMLWQGSYSLGDNSKIFTSVLYDGYRSPSGFCFDIFCDDDAIVANPNSSEYNVNQKSFGFAEIIRVIAQYYTSNNILIPMGGDFHYQEALSTFTNLDALINGFKVFNHSYQEKPINVFYSTPSCYIKAVNTEAQSSGLSYRIKTDDFLPYSSDYSAYWTGYYTSRPTSKRFVREGNNLLQIVKQLSTFVKQTEDNFVDSWSLQKIVAIMQHHDAITGTEKQHVANDYHKMLYEAIQNSITTAKDVLTFLLPLNPSSNIFMDLTSCITTNVSICSLTQNHDFLIATYNPLSRIVSHYVRLPVSNGCFQVTGGDETPIRYEIFPSISDFYYLEGHNPAEYDMVFPAIDIPPLGLKIFKVQRNRAFCQKCIVSDTSKNRYSIGTTVHGFELDKTTGLLKTISLNGITRSIKQEFLYYVSAAGYNTSPETRASGAYIFRPDHKYPEAIPFLKPNTGAYISRPDSHYPNAPPMLTSVKTTTFRGLLVEEVHQTFNPWIKQIIRLNKHSNNIEFDWLIGPIDIGDFHGKEVITRFTTDFNSGDVFYTDSNGRQMMKRQRNFRPSYRYSDSEPVSGNYYPVTSRISLKDDDENIEFAVLTDRSQGGSSLASGQIELMVHRRCLHDDGFGVNEELNERQFGQGTVARGRHYVTFGPKMCPRGESSSSVQKFIGHEKTLAPWNFLIKDIGLWSSLHKEFSGLTHALPINVRILTLEPWRVSESTILLRLEHIFEEDEHPVLSKPASLTLKGLFTFFDVATATEMTLGANIELEANSRLKWKFGSNIEDKADYMDSRNVEYSRRPPIDEELNLELIPMEIRTFILTVVYK